MRRRPAARHLAVLGCLMALAPFTIDTYLPALPQIAVSLGTNSAGAQETLAFTMIGFAFGQLIIGPWSDRVGRKVPLLVGLGVHAVSCVAAAAAPTLLIFNMARLFQGIGAAAGTVVALAIVRDLHSGRQLIRALGRMALISGVAPLIAPNIGAALSALVGWQIIFLALATYGLAMITATCLLLHETRPQRAQAASSAPRQYLELFKDRHFIGILVVAGMRFTALFAYLQASPFILQIDRGLSTTAYGVILAANSIGMFAGVQISTRISRHWTSTRVLVASLLTLTASGIAVTTAGVFSAGPTITALALFGLMFGCGLGLPMIQALGLDGHPQSAGSAAALIGASSFGMAGALAPLIALPTAWGMDTTVALGSAILITTALSLGAVAGLIRPRTPRSVPDVTDGAIEQAPIDARFGSG